MFRRYVGIRAEDLTKTESGLCRLSILASTDAPVDMGGWRECLSHAPGAIDTSAATALLLNHKPGWIVGALRKFAQGGTDMIVESDVDAEVKTESGMPVQRAIDIGALRGASIGYAYDREACTVDHETRTVRVGKWRLLELSLTPIPADAACGVRSVPFDLIQDHPATAPKDRTMSDLAPVAPAAPAIAPDHLSDQPQIATLARSLDLDPVSYLGRPLADAKNAMLDAVAARARAQHAAPAAPVVAVVPGGDDLDKQVEAIADAQMARVFGTAPKAGNPYAGRSLTECAGRFARSVGFKGSDDWSKKDRAHFVLGELSQVKGARDAANISTASFPNFVMANVITKIIAKGYEAAANPDLAKIREVQMVPDFKAARIGGLGTANLQETAENVAFPELAKAEGYFDTTAKMWGGTLSLSLQALINDDTASFDRSLRQAGAIAQKTIDRRTVQKLLRGTATTDASTWTNNTSSGCTMVYATGDQIAAARANIYRASVGMMNKIGLDGNPLGSMPRFLVCGPTNSLFAKGLLQSVGGQVVGNSGDLELVVTPWLEATALTGYSTTSYYLMADPMITTGLVLSLISGYESVQVQEYDAGAVGARKWKIWQPFEVDLFSVTNAAGTAIIPAAQQATT
jgi:phage head maturation protease